MEGKKEWRGFTLWNRRENEENRSYGTEERIKEIDVMEQERE